MMLSVSNVTFIFVVFPLVVETPNLINYSLSWQLQAIIRSRLRGQFFLKKNPAVLFLSSTFSQNGQLFIAETIFYF